jgi:hypothetical protein
MDKSKIVSVELKVATNKLEIIKGRPANALESELIVKRDGIKYHCEFSGMLEEFLAPFNIRETDDIIEKIELQISDIGYRELPEEFLDILKKVKELREKKLRKIWKIRFGPVKKILKIV